MKAISAPHDPTHGLHHALMPVSYASMPYVPCHGLMLGLHFASTLSLQHQSSLGRSGDVLYISLQTHEFKPLVSKAKTQSLRHVCVM